MKTKKSVDIRLKNISKNEKGFVEMDTSSNNYRVSGYINTQNDTKQTVSIKLGTNPTLVKLNKKEHIGMIDYLDSHRKNPGEIDVNEMFNRFNSKELGLIL
jgi:hypothetical protein